MSDTMNNGPIASSQFDRVQAAIWRNRNEPDGSDCWYSINIVRRYKDANGEWQSTSSFSDRDLPHVNRASEWAMRQLEEFSN